MLSINAQSFITTYEQLANIGHILAKRPAGTNPRLSPETRLSLVNGMSSVEKECRAMQMLLTIPHLERINIALRKRDEDGACTMDEFGRLIAELKNRIHDELE